MCGNAWLIETLTKDLEWAWYTHVYSEKFL
jgi:hypothetical protein